MKLKAALASLAAVFAAPAMAEVVVIDFDSMASNVHVLNYYAASKGVTFQNFITATGTAASSDPRYAYMNGPSASINVAGGFSGFNFGYGTMAPATIQVYSGLNGTGTLLGSTALNGNAMEFAFSSVAFAGIGHSVVLSGKSNYAALDDVAFTLPAIPEPQSWAMLLAGLAVTGFAARRR
ncbi:MAG TPA: PEPxxWA-CTERM sorting domain-containing protein [Telluria sp.]|nr:PEPxxWA-CTERM sorting domain-containing protein [Telluria sp.]